MKARFWLPLCLAFLQAPSAAFAFQVSASEGASSPAALSSPPDVAAAETAPARPRAGTDPASVRAPASRVPVAEPAGALAPPTSEPARFGGAAEVVITGAASLEASGSTSVVPQTRFLFAPSADVFVVRNFSVGGSLELGYLKQRVATVISSDLGGQQAFVEEHQRTTDWSVGPRVGVNLALGSFVSLYIRAGVSFGMAKTSVDPLFGPSAHFATHFVRAETSVPLLFHVAPHFFLGFGPELDLDLARSAPSTSLESGKGVSLGAFLTVGGWL